MLEDYRIDPRTPGSEALSVKLLGIPITTPDIWKSETSKPHTSKP